VGLMSVSSRQAQAPRGVGNRFRLIFQVWRVSIVTACNAIETR